MNERQLARFEVDGELLMDNPGHIAEIFSRLKIVPMRVEYLAHKRVFEYYAIGSQFEEVPSGVEVPTVTFEVTKEGDSISLVEVQYWRRSSNE
jgi:hypothetical protein